MKNKFNSFDGTEPYEEDDFDYQGKRPDQVESSYKIFVICLIVIIVILIFSI